MRAKEKQEVAIAREQAAVRKEVLAKVKENVVVVRKRKLQEAKENVGAVRKRKLRGAGRGNGSWHHGPEAQGREEAGSSR